MHIVSPSSYICSTLGAVRPVGSLACRWPWNPPMHHTSALAHTHTQHRVSILCPPPINLLLKLSDLSPRSLFCSSLLPPASLSPDCPPLQFCCRSMCTCGLALCRLPQHSRVWMCVGRCGDRPATVAGDQASDPALLAHQPSSHAPPLYARAHVVLISMHSSGATHLGCFRLTCQLPPAALQLCRCLCCPSFGPHPHPLTLPLR
jgi:hypothetical protein